MLKGVSVISRAALNDDILLAVANMVNDAQVTTREPSHSEIAFQIQRAGLLHADPLERGMIMGKAKRVRTILSWAFEHDLDAGERLVYLLLSLVRSCGGFRPNSPNYVGEEAITRLTEAFGGSGYVLSSDGGLWSAVLEELTNAELEDTLRAYAMRAKRGVADAALLVGTGKDLLEAVAAYVLVKRYGQYSVSSNFPTLLGQAFHELKLATPHEPAMTGESPQKKMERAMYELGCAVNSLRNKQGTGHGRPYPATVTACEAKAAIESIGVIAEFLLDRLDKC